MRRVGVKGELDLHGKVGVARETTDTRSFNAYTLINKALVLESVKQTMEKYGYHYDDKMILELYKEGKLGEVLDSIARNHHNFYVDLGHNYMKNVNEFAHEIKTETTSKDVGDYGASEMGHKVVKATKELERKVKEEVEEHMPSPVKDAFKALYRGANSLARFPYVTHHKDPYSVYNVEQLQDKNHAVKRFSARKYVDY